MRTFQCISPVSGAVYAERDYATDAEITGALSAAQRAQASWSRTGLKERGEVCERFVEAFVSGQESIAEQLSWQMGRPVTHAPGEVRGVAERARYMISIAEEALADIRPPPKPGYRRFIRRMPLGTILVIAPWNYPYLTAINAIIAAIMSGNAVILKPSSQTPLTAERFAAAFKTAGLPGGLFQYLHLSRDATFRLIRTVGIDHVMFTGSVHGGKTIKRAASTRFIGTGLELGGKDPAYVRRDAPLNYAVQQLADGAFYNAGQSCCAVERIYVHRRLYGDFVDAFVESVRSLRLGHPLERTTTLGPVVRPAAAKFVRGQVEEAVFQGARACIDPGDYVMAEPGTAYAAPQVLTNVDHSMRIMTEETFGPAVGIMEVASDEEAVALMNDSPFGLTGSVWTASESAALEIGGQVHCGTWFVNRCDYLDPALAWTGVKDSGQGCTLSRIGYEQLTRPKSFHAKRVG